MHPKACLIGFIVSASTSWSTLAIAGAMDPAIERLQICSATADGGTECAPDHAAFRRLVAQYGVAFAPTAMHSARTTGFGGFHLSLEGAYTGIDSDASYWHLGTRGPGGSSSGVAPAENANPSGVLQLYSLKLRKGFGMGVELTGAFGLMPETDLMSGGADVRISLLEGFRTGFLGYVPDIAIGGGIRTIAGTPQLHLTVASLDTQISKPFVFGKTAIFTPWLGYQFLWIFGDTRVVDFTPGIDALDTCNYSGDNVPDNPDPGKNPDVENPTTLDGQPTCAEVSGVQGTVEDFNEYGVFDDARLERHRLIIGASVQYEILLLGTQLAFDLISPSSAQNTSEEKAALSGMAGQWTFSVEAGVAF